MSSHQNLTPPTENAPNAIHTSKPAARTFLVILVFTLTSGAVLLVLAASLIFFHYGSISVLVHNLEGEYLTVDIPIQQRSNIKTGETSRFFFEFSNNSSQPIRLLGASHECGCTVSAELPITIAPYSQYKFFVDYHAERAGMFSPNITVFTDNQITYIQRLGIRAEVD